MKGIGKLANKPFFTIQDAEEYGISRRMLSYYVKAGVLIRIARGLYSSTHYEPKGKNFQWEDLAIAAKNIKGGVICLVSALIYYELTDEMMKEFWIAVDNKNSKVKFPLCRIIRMRNMSIGVNTIKLAGFKVKIFDRERTVIDSFRFLDLETAMKSLKIYLQNKKKKPNLNKMKKYTEVLHASKVREYIMALIT